MNMGVHVIQGKGLKYLAFLTALQFMKTMIWIGNMTSWWKNSPYNKKLQAALVRTITKRCSLGTH